METPAQSDRKKRGHVTVPLEEHRRLRILAAERGTTATAIVSQFINAEFQRHKEKTRNGNKETA